MYLSSFSLVSLRGFTSQKVKSDERTKLTYLLFREGSCVAPVSMTVKKNLIEMTKHLMLILGETVVGRSGTVSRVKSQRIQEITDFVKRRRMRRINLTGFLHRLKRHELSEPNLKFPRY